jgi:hypothetical protein
MKIHRFHPLLIIALSLSGLPPAAPGAAVKLLPAPGAPGAHLVINNLGPAIKEGVQTRFSNPSDYRAVTQSFQWNSPGALLGLGFRLAAGQTALTKPQNYLLAIYNAENWTPRSPVGAPVFGAEIELSGKLVSAGAAGSYLYFDLSGLGVRLAEGGSYLVVLGPDLKRAPIPGQRLLFEASVDSFARGVANQVSTLTPTEVNGNRFNFDLNFFATASQPASAPAGGANAAGGTVPAPAGGAGESPAQGPSPVSAATATAPAAAASGVTVKLLPAADVAGTAGAAGAHLVINNLGPAIKEGVQTRFSNPADYRAVTQSFQWNSPGALLGLGFRLASEQTAFTKPQTYRLAVYNAQNWTPRSPAGALVFGAEIEMSGKQIPAGAAGSYLYFDLSGLDVRLAEGGSYLAVLGPDLRRAPIPGQRFFFEASVDSFARGVANQVSTLTPSEVNGNRFNFDLNFFATASQPASAPPAAANAAAAAGGAPAGPPAPTAGAVSPPAGADAAPAPVIRATLAPADAADAPDVAINSDGATLSEAPQARWHTPADYRALTQSFQWPSDGELVRAGFRFGKKQEAFRAAENYIFSIYQTTGWAVGSRLGPVVFSGRIEMTPELTGARAAGNYLQLDLAPFHIKLTRGQCYLLLLAPDPAGRPVPGQRVFLDAASNPLPAGTGGQIPTFPPDAVTGTRFNFDLVFFLASSTGGAARGKSKLVRTIADAPAGTFFAYPHNNGFYDGVPVLAKYADGTQYFLSYDPADGREAVLGSATGLRRFSYYDIAENGLAAVCDGAAVTLVDLSGVAPNRVLYKAPEGCKLHMPAIRPDATAVALTLEKNTAGGQEYQLVSIEIESGRATVLMTKPFLLNHAQFSPFAPDWIMVSHEGSASQVKDRIWGWHASLAPDGKNLFAPQTGANGRSLLLGHERPLWHKEGQVFCVYAGSAGKPAGLYEVDFSGRSRVVSEGDAWHCDISRDGKWAVVDTQGDGAAGDIVAVNCRTGARAVLVEKIAYARHPWHPHPRISPDGGWIIYNNAAENNAVFIKLSRPDLAAFAP